MRISELSRASGVSIPTIKFYLREGLLPRGDTTAPNQATYSETHLRRLRLIRVLADIGGLDLQAVRAVLGALDKRDRSLHEVLGVAHRALGPHVRTEEASKTGVRDEVDRFVSDLGWRVASDSPGRAVLADSLAALRGLGREVDAASFEPYARAADDIAAHEIAALDEGVAPADLVESVVIGTVVYEAVLTALRRLAQEHRSATRFD